MTAHASGPSSAAHATQQSGFETDFVGLVDTWTEQQKTLADRAMFQFIVLRLLLVTSSASLPALTTIENKSYATAAAILVAVLTALDTQFRWGEEWRHFRSTQLTLGRLKREFLRRSAAIAGGRAVGSVATPSENFDKLFADVKTLLQTETDQFFKFRITAAQKQSETR